MAERVYLLPPARHPSGSREYIGQTPETRDAAHLWAYLLYERHPEIRQILLAYYTANARYKSGFLRCGTDWLRAKQHLTNGRYPRPTIPVAQDRLMCSVSSIVGTSSETSGQSQPKRPYSRKLKLNNPKSLALFDFSCPVNGENTVVIVSALKDTPYDWHMLTSGQSYHAVLDVILELSDLPLMWGNLLERFSSLSDLEYVQRHGRELADSLKTNSRTAIGLSLSTLPLFAQTFRDIFAYQGGYNTFSQHTILDWGHLYYSLEDLLRYFRGQSPGTGYLRISGKKSLPPPTLSAQCVGGQISLFPLGDYFSQQPPLPQFA